MFPDPPVLTEKQAARLQKRLAKLATMMPPKPILGDPGSILDSLERTHEKKVAFALEILAPREKRLFALWCAEKVLPYCEKKYPDDKKLARVLDSFREWVLTQCDRRKLSAQFRAAYHSEHHYPHREAGYAARAVLRLEIVSTQNEYTLTDPYDDAVWMVAKSALDAASFAGGASPVTTHQAAQMEQLKGFLYETYAAAVELARENHLPTLEGDWFRVVRATCLRARNREQAKHLMEEGCAAPDRERWERFLAWTTEESQALEVCIKGRVFTVSDL